MAFELNFNFFLLSLKSNCLLELSYKFFELVLKITEIGMLSVLLDNYEGL